MAQRVAGTGPIYEPNWFTKFNGVKASAVINRGDIITTNSNAAEKVTADDSALAVSGYAQALESKTGGAKNGDIQIQTAIAGSAIRMPVKTPGMKSGQRVKLDVTGGVQKFEVASAADIAAGKAIATFLHIESGDLSASTVDNDMGVFVLG